MNNNTAFTGIKEFNGAIIEGNGKRIKNLKIESTGNAGLILLANTSTSVSIEIKNLTIESGSIRGGSAGAFIAENIYKLELKGLTNKASVTGTGTGTGGLIGYAKDVVYINNAANTGAISGATSGGLIGIAEDTGTIDTSHSYQALKLVGSGSATTINNSYYLAGGTSSGTGGAPLTVAEFKVKSKFTNWDFNNTWKMGANYPELK